MSEILAKREWLQWLISLEWHFYLTRVNNSSMQSRFSADSTQRKRDHCSESSISEFFLLYLDSWICQLISRFYPKLESVY